MLQAATASFDARTPPEALLRRFDVPGPRYTSYPTADRFVDTFTVDDYRRALEQRMRGTASPLSLYVHIPFCESICFYCACNKIITRHHDRAAEYLAALETEIGMHAALLGASQPVSQLHLGGGTPTFLSDDELLRLMAAIRRSFALVPGAELSIEVDPRTVDGGRIDALARLGFNRLSFGVQDFDADVQRAVNRVQTLDSVRGLVMHARSTGYASINVDLIYGLPRQTPESIRRTVQQVNDLRPDRIALYAYAHLPQRFKPQRSIDRQALPTSSERVEMLRGAVDGFLDAGYVYIGMDHFALPDDSLAVAKREGRLHRNFQGYSTQPDCDLIGMGVSAIGRIGTSYSQNAKALPDYYAAVRAGRLPIVRGLTLDSDDLARRDAIMALMCQGRLDFSAIEAAHGIGVRTAFAEALQQLEGLARDGLVRLGPDEVTVTPVGWHFVRAVAMAFDKYVQSGQRERFSRIV